MCSVIIRYSICNNCYSSCEFNEFVLISMSDLVRVLIGKCVFKHMNPFYCSHTFIRPCRRPIPNMKPIVLTSYLILFLSLHNSAANAKKGGIRAAKTAMKYFPWKNRGECGNVSVTFGTPGQFPTRLTFILQLFCLE